MSAPIDSTERSLTHGDERDRLAQMFEQAPSLMALLREPNHRIVLANEAFQRLFGAKTTIGRTAGEILPPMLSTAAVRKLDEAYSRGEPVRLEGVRLPFTTSMPGEPKDRILDLILQPIRDPDGAVIGIFVEGSDVTERVLAEQRLRSVSTSRPWGSSIGV